MPRLSQADRTQLNAQGRDPDQIQAALDLLAGDRPWTRIHRPATRGDGIVVLDPASWPALEQAAQAAATSGRVGTFVPASGAATRLCAALWATWDAMSDDGVLPEARPQLVDEVLEGAPEMALWPALQAHGATEGDPASILDAMFGEGGLALDRQPKALVPFHRHGSDIRTAFDEHVVEASLLASDAQGRVRVHMTVAPEHLAGFRRAAAHATASLEDGTVDLSLSMQDPVTDMPALGEDGEPVRDDAGQLFLRAGGHGSLLGNLDACEGDVVLVKNVDNVVRAGMRGPVVPWRRRLMGLLVTRQAEAWALLEHLARGEGVAEAQAFCADVLGIDLPAEASALIDRLDRPWRVAGMVRNTGQPGGGPYWADGPEGVSLQIVEGAQIDPDCAEQMAIVQGASHFNPVDLALGLRDRHGASYDLSRYTDPSAVLFASKFHAGQTMRVIEHPGLWNGQMAGWNTVFVEIPEALFQPVKTLADLLGDGHAERGPEAVRKGAK